MKLSSARTLEALKPVLKDVNSVGPDPVYWVFGEVTNESWANLTIATPGKIGEEFPKTFGHYHPKGAPTETYRVISGQGVFQLQKRHLDENGNLVPERVEDVILIKAKPGDKITISEEWGHSWSNVGDEPLITFDDWRSGHTPDDYTPMEKMRGLAYYLTSESGEVKLIPNPNYQNLPGPKWMSAEEFADLVRRHLSL